MVAMNDPLLNSLGRPHGFEALAVEGELPDDLRGTLYRAGPGLFERFGVRVGHTFEADGAITAMRLGDDGVHGGSKVVMGRGFQEEERAGRQLYTSKARKTTRLANVFRQRSKATGNTSVMSWQGRLFALMEAAGPQEMHPDDLTTLGVDTLGLIKGGFSAHPKRVGDTLINFGTRYGRKMELDIFSLPASGAPKCLGAVEMGWAGMVHDFAVTERDAVFVHGPVKLSVLRALFGSGDIADFFQWKPDLGTEIVVAPFDDLGAPIRVQTGPFWTWHLANAYNEGDDVVLDLCRYPDFNTINTLNGDEDSGAEMPALWRYRVNRRTRSVAAEILLDRPCDFPLVHASRVATAHRYIWLVGEEAGQRHVFRFDTRAPGQIADRDSWTPPQGHVPSEAVIVPKGGATAETDVWALTLVHAPERAQSYLAVLDGARLAEGPVACAWFDQTIPTTYHGTWVPDA